MSKITEHNKAIPKSKFKNENHMRLLRGLFYETYVHKLDQVIYTLKDEDWKGYPSLYLIFLQSCVDDPTEYSFAMTYMDGWEHWEQLQECEWFKPYIERWRKESELKMKSKALVRVIELANTGGKDGYLAAKYLLEDGWRPKEKGPKARAAGRPTKLAVKEEVVRRADEERRIKDDMERLGVTIQ
jgi:hypothetical protein